MAKKSYGCSVLILIVLGAGGWYGYQAFTASLETFEPDLRSLPGKTTAEVQELLGDPSEKLSYRDHRSAPRIQDLVVQFPGIYPTKVDYRALIYFRFKRCGIVYVNRSGHVTGVEFGQTE